MKKRGASPGRTYADNPWPGFEKQWRVFGDEQMEHPKWHPYAWGMY